MKNESHADGQTGLLKNFHHIPGAARRIREHHFGVLTAHQFRILGDAIIQHVLTHGIRDNQKQTERQAQYCRFQIEYPAGLFHVS